MAKYALLIGVSDYIDVNHFPPIHCCKLDLREVFKRVVDPTVMGYQKSDVVAMHDDVDPNEKCYLPIESQIDRVMRQLAQGARKDDTLLLYFSGHGCVKNGESYLVAMDTYWDELGSPDKGLRLSRIKEILEGCKASRKLVIIDSCHSGEGITKSAEALVDETFHDALGSLGEGLAVLSSCEKNEQSWALPSQSVFTKYLLEGLDGKASDHSRQVTVFSLSEYVGHKVIEWARSNPPRRQTPTFYGKLHAQGFIIVPIVKSVATSDLEFRWTWRPDILIRSILPPMLGGYYTFQMTDLATIGSGKPRPTVRIQLEGVNSAPPLVVNAVLDSGADMSAVPTYILNLLGYNPHQQPTAVKVRSIRGHSHYMAKYSVRFRLARRTFDESMLAVDSLQDPILGLPWLSQFQVVMDFANTRILLRPRGRKGSILKAGVGL